ncbi:MAG: hypothetical protein M1828_003459 [Chrysothrix sp. TS-e1954]|nr:MAG: hypothetical protein M1828_003459 [Chrysothrix sp. TS-e1954]
MVSGVLCLAATAVGVSAHVAYFNRSEHHLYGARYLSIFVVACCTAVALIVRNEEVPFSIALREVAAIAGSLLGGIYSSLLIYRIFFHPLNKFPGAFMARVTSLWYTSQVLNADAPHQLVRLHQKYGDFVRVGSSDLSTSHPKATDAIYGQGTKCTKSMFYDFEAPYTSLFTSRPRQLHDKRRRTWSPAFSDKALRGYEKRIRGYGDKLTGQLGSFSGQPVNVSKWFNFYSFDVMGDLAFGESFHTLERGEQHWAITLLNAGLEPLGLMLPTWLFRLIVAIPGATTDYWKFINYCSQQLDKRWNESTSSPELFGKASNIDLQRKSGTPDISSTLIEPFKSTKPTGRELLYLQADSRTLIVAGSDTTAAALTHLFLYLAEDRSRVERLREELRPYVDENGDVEHRQIQDCDYLNGCLWETLRLNPPVPTMMPRLTPPEGITIGDTFVPGSMAVWSPPYVVSRNERCYTDAKSFIPERWFSKPEMVKEKTAWAPFSAGVYGCIGKPLALLELRTITTKIITKFDVALAPGEDGSRLLYKTKDHFTLGLADLNLMFEKRKL